MRFVPFRQGNIDSPTRGRTVRLTARRSREFSIAWIACRSLPHSGVRGHGASAIVIHHALDECSLVDSGRNNAGEALLNELRIHPSWPMRRIWNAFFRRSCRPSAREDSFRDVLSPNNTRTMALEALLTYWFECGQTRFETPRTSPRVFLLCQGHFLPRTRSRVDKMMFLRMRDGQEVVVVEETTFVQVKSKRQRPIEPFLVTLEEAPSMWNSTWLCD